MTAQPAEFWDENLKLHSEKNRRMSWLESPVILNSCLSLLPIEKRRLSINQWIPWFKEKYLPDPVNMGLSLGAGDGTLERHAIILELCRNMESFDISPISVETAIKLNKEKNLSDKIVVEVADLNNIVLEEKKYDVIFGSMIIHHIKNLENLFEQIKKSLKPNGLLILNEYIGPSQFQSGKKQIQLIENILELLPDHLKKEVITGEIRRNCPQPSVEYMNMNDPSEAIRSEEIVEVMKENLNIVEKIDYGGSILHQLMSGIMGSFDDQNPEHTAIIKLIHYFETELIAAGVIDTDFSVIVASQR